MEKDVVYICKKCDKKLSERDVMTGEVELSTKRLKPIGSDNELGSSIRIGKHKNCGGTVIISTQKGRS